MDLPVDFILSEAYINESKYLLKKFAVYNKGGGSMKDTRRNILTAARELFEKRGFAAATTRDIAALAGVSEVTLFRHFPSKRALFEETLHSCLHPYTVEEYLKKRCGI